MFGGHNDDTDDAAPAAPDGAMNGVNDLAATAGGMMPSPTPPAPSQPQTYDADNGFVSGGVVSPTQDTQDADAGASSDTEAAEAPAAEAAEAASVPAVPETPPPLPGGAATSTSTDGADLLDLKQQALQQLSPLVGHLDQTPEEKFRTTMMMIQATDNQGLLKEAYAAAQEISDDKVRAQALLDVVNEINYFTQKQQTTEQ